jgi:uncharacterized protein YfaP (DUF2135 family)
MIMSFTPWQFTWRLLALLLVLTSGLSAQLVNTSVRVRVGTGDDTLITGFVVGAQPKTFLFRAVGPTLGSFGVGGVLADPILTLFGSRQNVLASNNDWGTNPTYSAATITSVMASAGAFALPAGSRDAVLIATLPSGSYTVQVTGANAGTGVALFEAYEIAAPPSTGSVSGQLINAVTGGRVGGATMRFRSGVDARTGTIQATVTSGADGTFLVSLPAGSYTVEVAGSGFVTSYFNFSLAAAQNLTDQILALSTVLGANEVRIVLSWGSTPADLDAHLTGPLATGGRFHVYFSDAAPTGAQARLDLDDTDSFGPETITLTGFRPGIYRYSVHNYSNSGSTTSSALSSSRAQVAVFRGNSEVVRYTVPTGRTGDLWTVFEIDGSTLVITPRNEFSTISDPARAPAPPLEGEALPATDADLVRLGSKPQR